MPIYEYRCTACGLLIEVIQKLGDRPPRKCTRCSGRMQKMVSRAAFQLKGGGWYAEGYSKRPPKSDGTAGGNSGGDGSSGAKGDGGSSS